jgi:hypothetical protein
MFQMRVTVILFFFSQGLIAQSPFGSLSLYVGPNFYLQEDKATTFLSNEPIQNTSIRVLSELALFKKGKVNMNFCLGFNSRVHHNNIVEARYETGTSKLVQEYQTSFLSMGLSSDYEFARTNRLSYSLGGMIAISKQFLNIKETQFFSVTDPVFLDQTPEIESQVFFSILPHIAASYDLNPKVNLNLRLYYSLNSVQQKVSGFFQELDLNPAFAGALLGIQWNINE